MPDIRKRWYLLFKSCHFSFIARYAFASDATVHMQSVDVTKCQKFGPDDAIVARFIAELSSNDEEFYLHYLVYLVLIQQIGRFMGHSPIESGDHIDLSMHKRLAKFAKEAGLELNVTESIGLKHAIQARLRRDGHAERHMQLA